jgi:hypothetical protein
MRIRQLSFDFDAPAEVIVDIPVEALMEDVSGDAPPVTTFDLSPNDSVVAVDLAGG